MESCFVLKKRLATFTETVAHPCAFVNDSWLQENRGQQMNFFPLVWNRWFWQQVTGMSATSGLQRSSGWSRRGRTLDESWHTKLGSFCILSSPRDGNFIYLFFLGLKPMAACYKDFHPTRNSLCLLFFFLSFFLSCCSPVPVWNKLQSLPLALPFFSQAAKGIVWFFYINIFLPFFMDCYRNVWLCNF